MSYQWDRHTDTQTDRQIHADENNTSPKTKFLGEVTKTATTTTKLQEAKSESNKKAHLKNCYTYTANSPNALN